MEIIGIAAISVDGFITRHDDEGTAFASAADQQFFRRALREFDALIFGSNTFLVSKAAILNHLTPERLRIVLTRTPERYAAYQSPGMLEFTSAPPEEVITALQQRGKTRCAVLGGSVIYTAFLTKHLLDELWLTVEPKLFGEGKKLAAERMTINLRLKSMVNLSEDAILLKYAIVKPD